MFWPRAKVPAQSQGSVMTQQPILEKGRKVGFKRKDINQFINIKVENSYLSLKDEGQMLDLGPALPVFMLPRLPPIPKSSLPKISQFFKGRLKKRLSFGQPSQCEQRKSNFQPNFIFTCVDHNSSSQHWVNSSEGGSVSRETKSWQRLGMRFLMFHWDISIPTWNYRIWQIATFFK